LQQAGVLRGEGGGLIRTGGDHMGNVRSLSGLSRALFGGAGIGHQAPGISRGQWRSEMGAVG
jgi:hypothetical protein